MSTHPLELYGAGLALASTGEPTHTWSTRDSHGTVRPLELDRWCATSVDGDARLLDACVGPVLDVGCGPGRLAGALARRGVLSLGIDLSPDAVRIARASGATALLRSVFDRIPGAGRWNTVLLADGNLGIGGDPVALLSRCRDLASPGGSVIAELAPAGTAVGPTAMQLERLHHDGVLETSLPFPWAFVDVDGIDAVAAGAGLTLHTIWEEAGRCFAVLRRT